MKYGLVVFMSHKDKDRMNTGDEELLYEILSTLVLGFLIGLTGALAPGPTLVATINASLAGNWTAGLKVTLGHIVIETALFFLIILGLAAVASPYTSAIAVIGGIALIIFGVMTVSGCRSASLSTTKAQVTADPYMAGLLTSAANPYFWIWWLSVGSALLISSLEGGLILAVIFMIGHWGADASWYVFVSTGVAKGRTILSDTIYHRIMAACGVFLVLFGIYYLAGAFLPLSR
ncbi:MAG TPA: LysE family transporter [Methanoregula sp.]|nr:LysE family transporter [Methanoregula sp.]